MHTHQAEQRIQETLGLAKRQAEEDPQRQRGQDCEVRVPSLAAAEAVIRWCPLGDRLLAYPDRDIASAPEATLVLPSVPDSVLRLVLAIDSARLPCGHGVVPSAPIMDRDPELMLARGRIRFMHQRRSVNQWRFRRPPPRV